MKVGFMDVLLLEVPLPYFKSDDDELLESKKVMYQYTAFIESHRIGLAS